MGVDYRAVVGIGKEFEDKYEVLSFLEQHNVLDDEDRDAIDEDGIEEWGYGQNKVGVVCLNCYSGNYYFVGYELSCADPESFRKSFDDGMNNWDKFFPNDAPDMIKTVRVY
jgi:hypothetical protein